MPMENACRGTGKKRNRLRVPLAMSSVTAPLLAELIAFEPNVILATGGSTVRELQRINRTIPIVFASVTDPVGASFVH